MKEEKTFREFEFEVELPWELVLADVPEPDPGKLDFRARVKERPITRFHETSVVNKLIEHLNVKN